MKNKDFVKAIEISREIVRKGKNRGCPCVQIKCEWHGKCFECVLIHRTKRKHLPECLQPIIRERIAELAGTAEIFTVDKRPTKANFEYLIKYSKKKTRKV